MPRVHGFTGKVHQMDARVGGGYRMSFTNFGTGKSHSFGGKYVELTPHERIRYTDKFDDPNLPGEMHVTVTLRKVACGTELEIVQEGHPGGDPGRVLLPRLAGVARAARPSRRARHPGRTIAWTRRGGRGVQAAVRRSRDACREGPLRNDGFLQGGPPASPPASSANMSGPDPMNARASRVRWATVLAASAGLAATPLPSFAVSVQEALLLAVPAVALVSAEVKASATVNCGQGPITVSPKPFIEVGTGWFVDGRGYLITNAHVIDPAYRVPPWVEFNLKLRAVEEGCVYPALKARGLARGQRPDLEEELLRAIPIAAVKLAPTRRVSVLLSNGANLEAQVAKFSAPITLDAKGNPFKDSGRDLALLKIRDGAYPALSITDKEPKLGDDLHILGFPGVVRDHELLSRTALKEASATKGQVSGFNTDAIGQDVIQTDASAVHGNSGGPGVDDSGPSSAS